MSIADVLAELGQAIAEMFVAVAKSLGGIFFDYSATNTAGFTVTPLGYVALLSLTLGIIYFVFRWVTSLVKSKR